MNVLKLTSLFFILFMFSISLKSKDLHIKENKQIKKGVKVKSKNDCSKISQNLYDFLKLSSSKNESIIIFNKLLTSHTNCKKELFSVSIDYSNKKINEDPNNKELFMDFILLMRKKFPNYESKIAEISLEKSPFNNVIRNSFLLSKEKLNKRINNIVQSKALISSYLVKTDKSFSKIKNKKLKESVTRIIAKKENKVWLKEKSPSLVLVNLEENFAHLDNNLKKTISILKAFDQKKISSRDKLTSSSVITFNSVDRIRLDDNIYFANEHSLENSLNIAKFKRERKILPILTINDKSMPKYFFNPIDKKKIKSKLDVNKK